MRLVAKRRGDGILFNEALAEEGAVVFAKACELGLEGIVSKRAGSFYKSGRAAIGSRRRTPISSGRSDNAARHMTEERRCHALDDQLQFQHCVGGRGASIVGGPLLARCRRAASLGDKASAPLRVVSVGGAISRAS